MKIIAPLFRLHRAFNLASHMFFYKKPFDFYSDNVLSISDVLGGLFSDGLNA